MQETTVHERPTNPTINIGTFRADNKFPEHGSAADILCANRTHVCLNT